LLIAVPGPCTTFDDVGVPPPSGDAAVADAVDAASDVSDAASSAPTYLTWSEAHDVCSKIAACAAFDLEGSVELSLGLPMPATNYPICVQWLAGELPGNRIGISEQREVLRCMAAAKDCATANGCLPVQGWTARVGTPLCKTIGGCEGDYACGSGSRLSCSMLGGACKQVPSGYGCVTAQPCSLCPDDDAGTARLCTDGGTIVDDAIRQGFLPATECSPAGVAQCATLGGSHCQDASVVGCTLRPSAKKVSASRNASVFDCAAIGATCQNAGSAGTPAFYCARAGRCQPGDSTCIDGHTIQVCVDGVFKAFDCHELNAGATCSTNGGAPWCSAYWP
jgi:hypothetical protein